MAEADSMVERVANNICDALSHWLPAPLHKLAYEDAARAALTAMREPTEAMELAGMDMPCHIICTWRAMIDAALTEGLQLVGRRDDRD